MASKIESPTVAQVCSERSRNLLELIFISEPSARKHQSTTLVSVPCISASRSPSSARIRRSPCCEVLQSCAPGKEAGFNWHIIPYDLHILSRLSTANNSHTRQSHLLALKIISMSNVTRERFDIPRWGR